ncbi:MAG: UDP-N-acetylmuramoyl-tripeptide--D-alanyl-D-alanine ligase, partial [Ferruginibacter sp.]
MNLIALYAIYQQHPIVVTDTRKIIPGCIFIALKGPNFNGNSYAIEALEKGAAYCICDEWTLEKNDRILIVENSLETLQQLALHHRKQFNIPFIAITGSNGKTTTKELVNAVLSTSYKTYTTIGNLNNHIGVPLTLLSVGNDAEMVVIEMGANHQKEIESYCCYTLPTHGVITNCGKAHLEGFGGAEGVRKGKGELFNYLRTNNCTVFINNDLDYLLSMSKGIQKIIDYGTTAGFVTGNIVEDQQYVCISLGAAVKLPKVKTQLVGGYNLYNLLTAACIGKYFNVSDENIKAAFENYIPSNSRSQLIRKGSNQIVLDAYNANPTSMKAAIVNFANMKGNKKI